MKYLILKFEVGTGAAKVRRALPVIFADLMSHDDIAAVVCRNLAEKHQIDASVRSAGFINQAGDCYGYSEALKIQSLPGDAELIRMYDCLHGILDQPGIPVFIERQLKKLRGARHEPRAKNR